MGKFLHSFQFLKVANLYIQYQQLGEKEQVPILKSLKRKHYEIITYGKMWLNFSLRRILSPRLSHFLIL